MYNPEVLQDNLLVTFFDKSIKNNYESEQQNAPVFTEVTYISKVVPFKEKDSIERKARPEDFAEYPEQYTAYQNREKHEQEGTLVKNWNYASESEVQMLMTHKVVTVEQVAALDDVATKRMGNGGRALRDAARKFVEQASGLDAVKDELELLKKESSETIKELESTVADLESKLKDLNNADTRIEVKDDTPKRNTKRSK
jgi:hypothetical protein